MTYLIATVFLMFLLWIALCWKHIGKMPEHGE